MLGLRQLYWIDRRLRQIFPRRANEPFGGINVVLIGDFFQLPPVGERSLYDTKPPSNAPGQEYISAGQQLYRLFDRTIILDRVMRQQGEDETSVRFRDLLTGLREGTVAPDGFELLSSRVRSKLSVVERARFDGALRIYARKHQVARYNIDALETNAQPAIKIVAKHNCPAAKRGTDDDAEGLVTEMYLSIGARIMLTCNLLTQFGLVNGTMGTLIDIVWHPDDDPLTTLPSMLLFKPDTYDGPNMFVDTDGKAVVPILPLTRDWEEGARKLSRTMFPVVLAYAITVHKSQGLTLDRAVLDISEKDFAAGLTYVAISRVRTVDSLMIDQEFHIGPFEQSDTIVRRMRPDDKTRRAA
jgi:ATP-dependent DNA helicase PIF1